MKKLLLLCILCLASFASAEEAYLGIYMSGQKLGYESFATSEETVDGAKLQRSDSRTVLRAQMLGSALDLQMSSVCWSKDGRPVRMLFSTTSGGKTQRIDARFSADKAVVDINNSGTASQKTLPLPKDGSIVDDLVAALVMGTAKPGEKRTFYLLDPTTVSFVKNEATLVGPSQVDVKGTTVSAILVEVSDPRAPSRVFVSSKGDLIKVEAMMGMEIYPEPREEAVKGIESGYVPSIDLAIETSLKTDRPLKNPERVTRLTVRVLGRDLTKAPSDEHQTIKGSNKTWTVTVHPPKLADGASATIAKAATQKPEWTKPTMNIPSSSATFKQLAKTIVGKRATVREAALAIKKYVFKVMRPNAGIGVVRDATDVLQSKEGVCRDYAILTATLCRSAGIPARLASGLVNWDGSFYYHAWVEVWDGRRWIGIDSTTDQEQISAAHIKLAQGNVEDAFMFMLLDKVKVELIDARRS